MFQDFHLAPDIALNAIIGQDEIAFIAYRVVLRKAQTVAMNPKQVFGRGIDILRRKADISQVDLACAVDIDPGSLSRIIKGEQWPRVDKVEALAQFFGVQTSEIFRIGEAGAQEEPKEDSRRAALRRLATQMAEGLPDDQLDATFRLLADVAKEQRHSAVPLGSATNDETNTKKRKRS